MVALERPARTDSELFWILKNGSPGTEMALFIPLVLTEEDAWHVLLYVIYTYRNTHPSPRHSSHELSNLAE